MTEPSIFPPLGARLLPSSRQYHSTPQSPKHQRQHSDDFITRLSPMNAIDTFRAPSGPLKACMDAATPSEQSFALRAAVASKSIYEWLDELRDWPWPTEGGLGFQAPSSTPGEPQSRGRAGSTVEPAPDNDEAAPKQMYNGSLLESELTRYESRIAQIQQELDKLEIEDIKQHVLHNHIMPLSRPGTPASPTFDRHFGMSSLSSYVKMDDLTAVITATVVQALPNLSRLLRLMNAWSTRLTVLRRVPLWTSSLAEAEAALRSAWAIIEQGSKAQVHDPQLELNSDETPSQHNYEVTKLLLEKKVSTAARTLDYMLDNLEGRDDTLPDEWLDRMEVVERQCAEWTAAYEKWLRDEQLAALQKEADSAGTEKSATEIVSEEPATPGPIIRVDHPDGSRSQSFEDDDRDDADRPIPSVEPSDTLSRSPIISITNDRGSTRSTAGHTADESALDCDDLDADHLSLDNGAHALGSDENHRPGTAVSDASTVVRAQPRDPSQTPDLLPVNGTRASPHTPPRETRSTSMPVGDMPPVLEYPEDESSEDNSLDSSFNSNAEELGSPIVLSQANGEDDHMRKQISQILENIPAKIQLGSRPTVNHLNPPDLQLPYSKPRPTADRTVRSKSSMSSWASMSSRASTPSFMLAPAPRPRHQRGNQDIKLYHLSRANGEAPIKLFIRCVGENGERVMVRVGGGWADLGEYLKEYAIHHGRRSHRGSESKVEVRDIPRSSSALSTRRPSASPSVRPSPPSRPGSALDSTSPIYIKKKRQPSGGEDLLGPRLPATPLAYGNQRASEPPSSGSGSTGRSRSSSRLSWDEEDSSLGMAGPRSMRKDIPQESLDWVESIKEKVRAVSGGSAAPPRDQGHGSGKFGELGRVGGTKRLFRKPT